MSGKNETKKRIHVCYSGRVQGVGFRFTVQGIAFNLEVLGWVKNLSDGRVEIVAEADEEILKKFLERTNNLFSGYIRDIDIEWLAASGEFKDFAIRF